MSNIIEEIKPVSAYAAVAGGHWRLRLENPTGGIVWYRYTTTGFEVLGDADANELEASFARADWRDA